MEITVNDQVYELKASFNFLREIEPKRVVNDEECGLAYAVIQVQEVGDMRYLVDLLLALNAGFKPRLTRAQVESYLENLEDIDEFASRVIDFLKNASVCKTRLKRFLKAAGTKA